ncbi:MAG: ATP-binding protein [Acetatifactor sp.]|nr:ATP-binding protein [Acetatifactor sp.]
MKLLRVKAGGFKNCADDFEIDLAARAGNIDESQDRELLKIDEELYVYSTVGIIGKNASGKTSALEVLDWCYDILSAFALNGKHCSYHGVRLEMIFYLEGNLYKYSTELDDADVLEDRAVFKDQKLYCKRYDKMKSQQLYTEGWIEETIKTWEESEKLSILRYILKKAGVREIYYDAFMEVGESYGFTCELMKLMETDLDYLNYIIPIFDRNISALKQIDETRYMLIYQGKERTYSGSELLRFLSGGTTKGMNLYTLAVMSLKSGFDLLVDEIESYLHKTHVRNLIMLYRDREINRKNATLIFSTHDCELLDLFNRSDNIWVTHSEEKIKIENMYDKYGGHPGCLKSRFSLDMYDTLADYEAFTQLKQRLMQ